MFDCTELFAALDDQRRERGLDWNQLADDLFEQSFALNAELMDHGICPGAVVRFRNRGSISCQYAMFMLRWDLSRLDTELDEARSTRGLGWVGLAPTFECSPSRLTNLRTAKLADMDLVMRVTQWLGRPATAFIHPATW
jgi:hypothetical protein